MGSPDNRIGIVAVVSLLMLSSFSIVAVAQNSDAGEGGIAWGLILCLLPLMILALFGILWSLAYPALFIWGAAFSSGDVEKSHQDAISRRMVSREKAGKEILNTINGGYRGDVSSSGLVHANGVFGPSHWQLLIAFFNNLVGGSVTSFQQVISAGRAEVMQRLREQAEAQGWDEVINVRIDTSSMTPQSQNNKNTVRGVEIFAYGTGIRYD